jgi:hypothetical protein
MEKRKIFPLPEVQYLNLFQVPTFTAGENPIKNEMPNIPCDVRVSSVSRCCIIGGNEKLVYGDALLFFLLLVGWYFLVLRPLLAYCTSPR